MKKTLSVLLLLGLMQGKLSFAKEGSGITYIAKPNKMAYHFCTMLQNRTLLHCEGLNDFGQATIPEGIKGRKVRHAATGGKHTCIIINDMLSDYKDIPLCWGKNDWRQAEVSKRISQNSMSSLKIRNFVLEEDRTYIIFEKSTDMVVDKLRNKLPVSSFFIFEDNSAILIAGKDLPRGLHQKAYKTHFKIIAKQHYISINSPKGIR